MGKRRLYTRMRSQSCLNCGEALAAGLAMLMFDFSAGLAIDFHLLSRAERGRASLRAIGYSDTPLRCFARPRVSFSRSKHSKHAVRFQPRELIFECAALCLRLDVSKFSLRSDGTEISPICLGLLCFFLMFGRYREDDDREGRAKLSLCVERIV